MNRYFLNITFCCPSFLVAWCCAGTLVFAQQQKELPTDSLPNEISYQISMSKKNYRYGEQKVVTSTIKNIGKRKIRVRLPTAANGIVDYEVFKKTPKGFEEAGESLGGIWGRGWAARTSKIVELAPGESCSAACEMNIILAEFLYDENEDREDEGKEAMTPLAIELGLEPGEYVLKANYHLVETGEKEYSTKIVPAAKQLIFTVRKLTKIEQEELEAFKIAYSTVSPFKRDDNVTAVDSMKLLKQFLKDYPDSPYRLLAYIKMQTFHTILREPTRAYSFWKKADDEGLHKQLCQGILDRHHRTPNKWIDEYLKELRAPPIMDTQEGRGKKKKPWQKKLTSASWKKEFLTDNLPNEISYQISMSKKNYRYAERKVVTSTIKNIGKRKIRVRLPTAMNGVVTYYVFQKTPEGFEEAGESGHDLAGRSSSSGIVELAPGESCSTACEVGFILAGSWLTGPSLEGWGLDPGEYVLKANYHLVDSGKGYREKIVPATKQLIFTVRKLTKIEQEELETFLVADGSLFPFKINGVRAASKVKPIEQFLKDYPDSSYRLFAYTFLQSFYIVSKERTKAYNTWKKADDEGLHNQLCEELLDYHRDHDVDALIPVGKFQEAIKFLKGSRDPFEIIAREGFKRRYKKKMQAEKNPSTTVLPKENSAKSPPLGKKPQAITSPPPKSSNNGIIIGMVIATIVILLLIIITWKFRSRKQKRE